MFTVTINGNSIEELYANLENLLKSKPGATNAPEQPTVQPAPAYVPPAIPMLPAAPAPQAAQPIPQQPAMAAPPPAPTANAQPPAAAPTYTLDQLAKAGADLAQTGKMEQALALLAKYGVQTVNQLQPDQYGAFATELRNLGAQV